MKIVKLLNAASLSLAATPMSVLAVESQQVNLADVTINMGESVDCYWTVRFTTDSSHTEWGTFAEIYKMKTREDQDIRECVIPATVKAEDGNDYKIKRINTRKDWSGKGTINELDLSKAIYLEEIADNAFSKEKFTFETPCQTTIKSVNWNGAVSLKTIGESAFYGQALSPNFGHGDSLNFLNTSLENVKTDAFYEAGASDGSTFERAIFPKSARYFYANAFGADDKYPLKAKKIIFTDPTGALFVNNVAEDTDSMLLLDDFNADDNEIIIPVDSKDIYCDKVLADTEWSGSIYKKYRDKLHESSIGYDSSHRGSYKVVGIKGLEGVDKTKATWTPWAKTEYATDATTYLYDNYDGKFGFDSLGRLTWSNNLALGEYDLRVISYRYDDTAKHKLSVAISDVITMNIIDASLKGGSSYLKGESSKSGKDSKYWGPVISSTPSYNILSNEASLKNIPTELTGKVHLVQNPDNELQYKITWDKDIAPGKYSFALQQTLVLQDKENPVALKMQYITLQIDETPTSYGMTLSYKKNDTGSFVEYTGETIKLGESDKVEFQIVTGLDLGYGQQPQLSLTNIDSAEIVGSERTWTFTIDASKQTKYSNSRFNFCVYALEKIPDTSPEETIAAYSDIINIEIGDVTTSLVDVATDVYVNKNVTGAKAVIPVIDGDDVYISKVNSFVPTKWNESDPRKPWEYVSYSIDESNKNIILEFAPEYFASQEALDVMDFAINLNIQSYTTNTAYNYQGSFSVISQNSASFKYEGDTSLYGYPNKTIEFEKPFIYQLNGEPLAEKLDTIKYSCEVECDNPEFYKDNIYIKESDEDNSVKLVCDKQTVSEVTQGGLKINIYATDEDNVAIASTTVTLYVDNMVYMDNVPEKVSSKAYQSGTTEKPIITKFNGDTIASTYKLVSETISEHVSIDENGYIHWDNQLAPGTYDVSIFSTVEIEEQQYTIKESIEFVIDDPEIQPKDNTLAIAVSCSAVGGAGASAGVSVGVIKAKKRPKVKK